ncbi:MAG: hypothetical protein ACR2F6_00875 [Mycobacteriales bacterium]
MTAADLRVIDRALDAIWIRLILQRLHEIGPDQVRAVAALLCPDSPRPPGQHGHAASCRPSVAEPSCQLLNSA